MILLVTARLQHPNSSGRHYRVPPGFKYSKRDRPMHGIVAGLGETQPDPRRTNAPARVRQTTDRHVTLLD